MAGGLRRRYPSRKRGEAKHRQEKGCEDCKNTGFKGRIGIFEIMVTNDEIKELIVRKESANKLMKACIMNGMKTLRLDGIRKVLSGETSVSEVLRLT